MTIGSILKKTEGKFSKDLSTGLICKINCQDCDKFVSAKHEGPLKIQD